ncbi:MAG: hypothetical protein WCF84_24990 [Anaerolineae bacterium]
MKHIFGASWGRNLVAALLAAILFALLGIILNTPRTVTIFAAAIFGALLILIVQIGEVIQVLWASRGAQTDIGEAMLAEVETPAGQEEVKRMSFNSLLTVAIVQELYLTLFKRDRPLWAFEFLGMAEEIFSPRDYGWINRYLEWVLIILIGVLSIGSALLMGIFVYQLTTANGITVVAIVSTVAAFLLDLLIVFPISLFLGSVIRRIFVLYSTRANPQHIGD